MGTATLEALISALEAAPADRVVRRGFKNPHSYRGYYEDLAFEPAENVTVGSMLEVARSAIDNTYEGYKGGTFRMSEWSTVWLAWYGETGETLGPNLVAAMLRGEEPATAPGEATGWIAFSERMPEPRYNPENPGPTHGYILVTNNLEARDRWGKMSHVWLVAMVHTHETDNVFNGNVLAVAGEITALAHPGDMRVRGLTHWRPAVPEEWVCEADSREEAEVGPPAVTTQRAPRPREVFDLMSALKASMAATRKPTAPEEGEEALHG